MALLQAILTGDVQPDTAILLFRLGLLDASLLYARI